MLTFCKEVYLAMFRKHHDNAKYTFKVYNYITLALYSRYIRSMTIGGYNFGFLFNIYRVNDKLNVHY